MTQSLTSPSGGGGSYDKTQLKTDLTAADVIAVLRGVSCLSLPASFYDTTHLEADLVTADVIAILKGANCLDLEVIDL